VQKARKFYTFFVQKTRKLYTNFAKKHNFHAKNAQSLRDFWITAATTSHNGKIELRTAPMTSEKSIERASKRVV